MDKHGHKILTIILPCAFTAVSTFFFTIMAVGDRIDEAEALFHRQNLKNIEKHNTQIAALTEKLYKELEAIRSECKKDRTALSSHISKIEIGMSKVEECVFGYLKPSATDIGSLKTKFELLRSELDSFREQYSNEMKIANSRTDLDEAFRKYMQTNDVIRQERTPPQSVDKPQM